MRPSRVELVPLLLLGVIATANALSLQDRVNLARDAAVSSTNACSQLSDTGFYWELGDGNGKLLNAGGTVDGVNVSGPDRDQTEMNIASASKWVYATYVAERFGAAALSARDYEFMTMSSGYHSLDSQCAPGDTVDSCLARCTTHPADQACHAVTPPNFYSCNSDFSNDAGQFYYDGGHFEANAGTLNMFTTAFHGTHLGGDDDIDLQAEFETYLPPGPLETHWITFTAPVLAGNIKATAGDYIDNFLRKVVAKQLQEYSLLGTHAVCTDVYHLDGSGQRICPSALYEPPGLCQSGDIWHYSVGHWVEDDPGNGDGSFNSAGSRGFYPWIWKFRQGDDTGGWTETIYGVVARDDPAVAPDAPLSSEGWKSVECGQAIRTAFLTGNPQ